MIGDNGAMSTPGRLGIGIIGMGHVGPVIASALRAAIRPNVTVSGIEQEPKRFAP